jgi:hypothetical protein
MTPADIVIPVLLVAWMAGSFWIDHLRRRSAGHRSWLAEVDADVAAGRDPMKQKVNRYHVAIIALLIATAVLVWLAERFLG